MILWLKLKLKYLSKLAATSIMQYMSEPWYCNSSYNSNICQNWLQHLEAVSRRFEEAKWLAHGFEILDAVMFGKRKIQSSKIQSLKNWNFWAVWLKVYGHFFDFWGKVLPINTSSQFRACIQFCRESRELWEVILAKQRILCI